MEVQGGGSLMDPQAKTPSTELGDVETPPCGDTDAASLVKPSQ